MSFSDTGKMCTFSEISGVITKDGKPVKNAILTRTTDREKVKTDQAITDENGFFSMPALYERSIAKFLPQEFVVSQTISVKQDNGDEVEIWSGIKRHKEENSESRGKPLVVQCELNSEETTVLVGSESFITRCSWDVISDEPFSEDDFFDTEDEEA